ncbi:uncharacterized protein mslna [Alosa sapidissima]|uniref:uncharacterized protein mslna n=1 Tax=Alosa sapidissima TaxID=34773 RepID=UPI001C0919FD|nr:uncharacterized protein mslna [Alosa sapidissima]
MTHKQKYALLAFAILGLGLCHTASAQECRNSSNPDQPQRDPEEVRNATQGFLTCADLGSMDTAFSPENAQKLRGLLDIGFDFYNFLRASRSPGPVEDLIRAIRTNHSAVGDLRDPRFMRAWFHVRLRPQLAFQSKDLLSCLSQANLSCESYQALVMELSEYKESMHPTRQMMVYKEFILPFLTNSSKGCVENSNSSGDWLIKNFQSFASFAFVRDLIKLNMNFNALKVLDKLTPEQKVELILYPDTFNLNNQTIVLVLQNLIQPLLENHLNQSMLNMTTPSNQTSMNSTSSNSTEIHPKLQAFLIFLRPLGSFIHQFVSTVRERNESSIKGHVLAQVVVNWTLSQLAGHFSQNFTLNNQTFVGAEPTSQMFNVTNFEDWFQHVVVPLLKRFLPGNTTIPQDLTAIFNHVFNSNNAMVPPEPSDPPEICNINHNSSSTCLVPETTVNLAVVLRCVTNTTSMNVTGERIKSLVAGLVGTLRDQMKNAARPNVTYLSGRLPSITLNAEQLRDADVVGLWAGARLAPALSMLSKEYRSCLSAQDFSCEAFQAIVRILGQHVMDRREQHLVYTEFIVPFLSRNNTRDPGCVRSVNDSRQWLERNFGPFSVFANLSEFNHLNQNFSAMDALCLLTTTQLADFALTPGQLRDPQIVQKILSHVGPDDLGNFFDRVSPAIPTLNLTQDVRSAILKQVFDKANLSNPALNDTDVLVWLDRLSPFLPNMTEDQVKPFFAIVRLRDCSTTQRGVDLLNSIRPTLMKDTQEEIQKQIEQTLKEPSPLRCYQNNSFLGFLNDTFHGFELPKLTGVLSLIPPGRRPMVISSIHPSELGDFLSRPDVVENDTELCTVFNNYNRTPEFLEQEMLPEDVRGPVLPCIWPLALAAENQKEADQWFDVRLKPYLPFLNKTLLTSADTLNASCLPFRKLVGFLGTNFSFNGSDFTKKEAFDTVKTYLQSDSTPKCYSPTDPKLNSTAWFVNYIGAFVIFVTSDDLDTFGSTDILQTFTVNPQNIQLFSENNVSQTAITSYTQLLFLQNPTFNPITLPPVFQCLVPGSVYTTLNQSASLAILANLHQTCVSSVDQEISSALAGNIQTVNAETIGALGQQSVGLTPVQITSASPKVIFDSISTFSNISGWSQGQLSSIITILFQQNYQVNSAANLLNLGTLVGGLPSTTFTSIPASAIIQSVQNPTFVTNLLSAPPIVQQTCVRQIVKADSSPSALLAIPSDLVTQIPRNLVLFQSTEDAININKKKWKQEQAVLFFDTVATGIPEPDDLSVDVLQGFTCSRVRTFQKTKVRRLIRACRRRGARRKVVLQQTQLTCMYNLIKAEKPTDFANYSSDMLLYFNYADIPQASCKSYFTEAGNADFTVLNRALSGRRALLLNNARQCLGITGMNINRENVEVLGNMACTLDQSYIVNSDPEILEKLKNCNDFTDAQSSAMQTVLINGNTKYGLPARWREKTLDDLGILPLYLNNDFWGRFETRTKARFLRRFLRRLRRGKTQKRKLKRLFRQLLRGTRSKRGADQCTVGNITRATITDDSFPFGYDETQFRHCLSAEVVKGNLAILTEKVDVDEFQRVILDRLNEAYPSGLSDQQVQLLGSVSRVATITEINKWNISSADSLAALMNSDDGEWEAEKSKVIVTKFLKVTNNSLGSTELNFVGGPNLCALDTSSLSAISSESIEQADALDISNCTTEKKRALFTIAQKAFPINFLNRNSNAVTNYQLIQPYLGGATLDYVRSLSLCNVSMDIDTLIDLDESVLLNLRVSEVSGLLGNNLADLESFQNETVIQNWISRQLQSDLDTLNLNLTGGRADVTTASTNTTEAATTTAASNTTTTATTTTATTTTVATTASAGNIGSSYSLLFIFLNLVFIKMYFV